MQSCIKVANEAPTDLSLTFGVHGRNLICNMFRIAVVPNSTFQHCSRSAFSIQLCLVAEIWAAGLVTAVLLQHGRSQSCADVFCNYIDNNDDVPWDDLRYILADVRWSHYRFLGSPHNNTYLEVGRSRLLLCSMLTV